MLPQALIFNWYLLKLGMIFLNILFLKINLIDTLGKHHRAGWAFTGAASL